MAFLYIDTDAEFINNLLEAGDTKKSLEMDIDELKQKYALLNRKEKKEFRELVKEKWPLTAKVMRW